MSAKSDDSELIGNHVPHHRGTLPTVDEDDEITQLDDDVGDPQTTGEEEAEDVDEPAAMSSSEATLTDTETKEAVPDGPTGDDVEPELTAADSGDQSSTTSEDFDPTTIVRQRRDATAFLADGVDPTAFKQRAAELGYSNDDEDLDDDVWESSDEEDEYIGLIPMLCSRCMRCIRREWFELRAKHFLVWFNVILCMCGIALVCIGLWIHICRDRLFYAALLQDNRTTPLVVLSRLAVISFGVGCVVAAMCFVGGCGAATECICFLVTHALLSTLCIIAQIVAAILSSVFQETIYSNISTSMQYQVKHLYNTTGARYMNTSSLTYRVTVAWDHLQRQLECCGGVGPTDYHYSTWFNRSPEYEGLFVPMSCCGTSTSHDYFCQFEAIAVIQDDVQPHNLIHTQGCLDAILDWYATYRPIVVLVVIIIDILLLIDIVSSLVLVRMIQRMEAEYGWRTYHY